MDFPSGPRRTIPLHGDFDINDATTQRALNWSAIFDEEETSKLSFRNVSDGQGLIVNRSALVRRP